jgi:hypothetical protein
MFRPFRTLRTGAGRPATRRHAAPRQAQADRIFIATLVIGFFAIALLLVTIYPSPMHLLRLY